MHVVWVIFVGLRAAKMYPGLWMVCNLLVNQEVDNGNQVSGIAIFFRKLN